MMNGAILVLLFLLSALSFPLQTQMPDNIVRELSGYIEAVQNFGEILPQEKVYLHLNSASYYQGDPIWFQCHVVTSELNRPSDLSKALYIELLNPGGEVIAKRVLPVRNSRCHGSFELAQLPFYSGFHEVRTYTRYMLNFGEEVIFSRVLLVFDKPRVAGGFREKDIQEYVVYKYPQVRKKTAKEKKANLRFFPEGGNLVEGIPSRIASEAVDAYGNSITLSRTAINREKKEITSFTTVHEGHGTFVYTPTDGGNHKTGVELNGKRYHFDLPETRLQGYALQVDNLSSEDSIAVNVQKNPHTPKSVLGSVVLGHGKLPNYCLLNVRENTPVSFKPDKTEWKAGVTQIVLFSAAGQIIADRLIFMRKSEPLTISVRKNKEDYQPFDRVLLDFSVRDTASRPVSAPISVSVRDGWGEVESRYSMLADLLLMSEVKGYVRRPLYYFETDDKEHRTALDHLLLMQGWRRYAWKYESGVEPFELKYMPEQGIGVHRQVVSFVRGKLRPSTQVSSFLAKRGDGETSLGALSLSLFETDSMGRFAFITDIIGKWNLILSVMERGKWKNHRTVLDRVFSPRPTQYPLEEMQISLSGRDKPGVEQELQTDTVISDDIDYNRLMDAYEDSLSRRGMRERNHRLGEVVMKVERQSREKDIYESRSKSAAYYDVPSEMGDILDKGGYVGEDIHELLVRVNPNFIRRYSGGEKWLQYRGRPPLCVINYKRAGATKIDQTRYRILHLMAIRSIYVSEELSTRCRYANIRISPMDVDEICGCIVFIETYPGGEIPVEGDRGVRKIRLDGYSEPVKFYHPDYSVLLKEEDYRRTLYWNPEVMPDKAGNARVRFYNSSRCHRLEITAETISADGTTGMFNE